MKTDAEIKQDVMAELAWDPIFNPNKIGVAVSNGVVTLSGHLDTYAWSYQRDSVLHALSNLKGVLSLNSRITLRRKQAPADLQTRIKEALARRAEREARHIDIDVQDDCLTLRSYVDSWLDRDAVCGAVWNAPGISTVVNEIRVEPGERKEA